MMKTELYLCKKEAELHLSSKSMKINVYGVWDANSPLRGRRGKIFLFGADIPNADQLSDVEYNNLNEEIEDALIDDRECLGNHYVGQKGVEKKKLEDAYNFEIPDFEHDNEEAFDEYEKSMCIVTDQLIGYDVNLKSNWFYEGGEG